MSDKATTVTIDPAEGAAFTITTMNRGSYYRDDLPAIRSVTAKELNKQIALMQEGDLSQIEAMLYAQAITLQEVFNRQVAYLAVAERLNEMQVVSQIALKAQNQCRATLATLADIKRPNRTIVVHQQNNALNQQINCAKNEPVEKNIGNELLSKEINHEALDTGRTDTSIRIDKKLDAVEISRSENSSG